VIVFVPDVAILLKLTYPKDGVLLDMAIGTTINGHRFQNHLVV